MQHTPGPWRATDRRPVSGDWGSRIPFAIELVVGCSVAPVSDVCDQPEAEANASLISAAPDLLAVVQELAVLGHGKCTIGKPLADMARAALAKATPPSAAREPTR